MCDTCGQIKCCCNEKRISVQGLPGTPGAPGKNSYTYIAYASNVVPGAPDVVTDFSLTTPDCWIAIRVSSTPLVPVQSDFQGKWFDTCTGNSYQYIEQAPEMGISNGLGNLNADVVIAPTPVTLTVLKTGKYAIKAFADHANILYATARSSAANLFIKARVNGSTVATGDKGQNEFVGHIYGFMESFIVMDLTAGDVVDVAMRLVTPNTDESVSMASGKVRLYLQKIG